MLKAIARLVSPKNSEDAKILQELHQASARLEAARILTEKQEMLAVEATHYVEKQFPESLPIQPVNHELEESSFLSDISYLIKIIAYSLVSSSTEPINQYLITDINSNHQDFESYLSGYKKALDYIKTNHHLSGDAALEANHYIDYTISNLK